MSKARIGGFTVLAVLPIVLALWLAGFDVSYQLGNYVVSDNAVVAGDVYQASTPAAGQVADLLLDVGDAVEKGQGVANVLTMGAGPAGVASRLSASVRSPAPGTVVRLSVVRGQSVTSGQSIATVADLSNLWVVASVDETSFKDIRVGVPVEVKLNALDRTFQGSVAGVVPDLTTPSNGARPTGGGTGALRPMPQVPVRIAVDWQDATVYPGMTATVKIFVR